jgi:hypothetical protein
MTAPKPTTSIHSPGGDNGPLDHEAQKALLAVPPGIEVQILEQLKALVQLQQHQATSKEPIMTEFIWNTLLQIIALIAAALFGAFSILAWQIGRAANGLASQSNSLGSDSNCLGAAANWFSLFSYCQDASLPSSDRLAYSGFGTELIVDELSRVEIIVFVTDLKRNTQYMPMSFMKLLRIMLPAASDLTANPAATQSRRYQSRSELPSVYSLQFFLERQPSIFPLAHTGPKYAAARRP